MPVEIYPRAFLMKKYGRKRIPRNRQSGRGLVVENEVVKWRNMSKKIPSTTKKKCAELLATNADTQKDIAQVLDISDRTISRWKEDPKFVELIEKFQRRETLDRLRRYKAGANKAFQKLLDLLECGDPKVELAAAKEIIRLAGDEAEIGGQESNGKLDVLIKGFLDG